MSKRPKNIIVKEGLDEWVMTYGDMMSLLLTFFVLIVSFSSMQESKFHQAANSLRNAFGVMINPESVIELDHTLIPNEVYSAQQEDLEFEARNVEKAALAEGMEKDVTVEVKKDGILFRINAPFLFRSGTATLSSRPKVVLNKMAAMFQKYPYRIRVEGHTDNVPIHSDKFPSNWELSAARAVSVARYFQGLGVPPQRIAATGYGEFRPIADNNTPEGRAKNRRVEVFLQIDRKSLPRQSKLPLVKAAADQPAKAPARKAAAAEKATVRPIINPVTGKLGALPVKRPE